VEFILKNGKEQAGEGYAGSTNLNISRGNFGVTELNRNKGSSI
jgi:hypothetical protein